MRSFLKTLKTALSNEGGSGFTTGCSPGSSSGLSKVKDLGRSGQTFNITWTNQLTDFAASASSGAFSVQKSNFASE